MTARLLCILILLGLIGASCGRSDNDGEPRVRIGKAVWKVELATDARSRRRGLAGRDEVPEGTGMLFVFGDDGVRTFHMLNCRVPLDIAFISSDMVIKKIDTMGVEADPSNPKGEYCSGWLVQYVLEVPAGALDRAGVSVGDRVELLGAARNAAKDTP